MIGLIGVGNMAGAIINGCVFGGVCRESEIGLYDVDAAKYESFPQAKTYTHARTLVEQESVILFSVKPQVLPEVLQSLAGIPVDDKLFISICAGISTAYIEERLPGARVVRAMPNTPMLYGKGVCALSQNARITDDEFARVQALFAPVAKVFVLPESQMNAVIALTSSSPAYLFLLADAMARGAVEEGFAYDDAVELCADVFEGAAQMLRESPLSPAELCDMVASPGGTTLAALDVLEQAEFSDIMIEAMRACTKRAAELSE